MRDPASRNRAACDTQLYPSIHLSSGACARRAAAWRCDPVRVRFRVRVRVRVRVRFRVRVRVRARVRVRVSGQREGSGSGLLAMRSSVMLNTQTSILSHAESRYLRKTWLGLGLGLEVLEEDLVRGRGRVRVRGT